MSILGVTHSPTGIQATQVPNFSLPSGDDFAARLQLGQVIKGRVLRHYEGSRYAVDFNGQEKVVDSAVPLKTGEVLHGKVVGLGERVELERVRSQGMLQPKGTDDRAPTLALWSLNNRAMAEAAELLGQHQVRLTAEQLGMLEQALRNAPNPQKMAQTAIFLSKLGIAITSEWLKAAHDILAADAKRSQFTLSGKALELQVTSPETSAAKDSASATPITEIATLLKQLVEDIPERAMQDALPLAGQPLDAHSENAGTDLGHQQAGHDMRRWLMNVQTGGSVGHRTNTIPLLVNGRLLELNIAVFEQTDHRPEAQATRHRQLSLSLQTEQLGQVDAHLVVTGEHVKMALSSDRETAAEALSHRSRDLQLQLKEDGWVVGEVKYEVSSAQPASVTRAVMQHVISQDNMSRLI